MADTADPPLPPGRAALLAAPHGADEGGLIFGWVFGPDGQGRALASSAEAVAWLAAPPPAGGRDGFAWLHVNLAQAGALDWLRRHARLDPSFFDTLAEGSRSTRLERDGDAVFGVVNDLTYQFDGDASDLATLWLNVTRDLIVTARREPLRAVDRLRQAVKAGEAVGSPIALLDRLLRHQMDELRPVLRRTTDRIDDIEDALLAGRLHHGAELARLRRLLVRLQRLMAPEPGALARLLTHPPAWVRPQDVEQLHGASEDFALLLRDVATLQERAKLMQDEAASRVAEANGRSLFTLTMVTVLALPINLIAGLLGMNVGGIPLAQHGAGFWIMLAIIATLTALIGRWALRRIGGHRR